MVKSSHKTSYKAPCLIIIILCILLVTPILVSAMDFDNIKSFDKNIGEYGKVTIKDWFGLQDLAELELKENTDSCFQYCSAKTEIIMHQDGVLIDDIKFMIKQNDGSWKEGNILGYKFYIDNDLYKLGTEVKAGTYQIRLEGKKNLFETVDWQITSQGKLIDDWALWGTGSEVYGYWPMNETSGTNSSDYSAFDNNISWKGTDDTNWVEGIFQNGIFLNGTKQWGTINGLDDDLAGTKEITISIWVNASKGDAGQLIINDLSGAGDQEIFLEINPDLNTLDFISEKFVDISPQKDISGAATFTVGQWYHIVVIMNYSGTWSFIDGSFVHRENSDGVNNPYASGGGTDNFALGARDDGTPDGYFQGELDEFIVYNRSLTTIEITSLYAEGSPTEPTEFEVVLISPTNNSNNASSTVNFNATLDWGSFGLRNATVFVWNSSGTIVNQRTEIKEGSTNSTLIGIDNLTMGTLTWNILGCGEDLSSTECEFASNNYTLTYGVEQVFETFNSSTIETSNENFILNLNIASGFNIQKASLIYNNTVFNGATITGSGTNFNVSRSITIPQGDQGFSSENRTFIFNITLANDITGTTTDFLIGENNQTVNELSFGFCRTGLAVPMLNFTIVNEITGIEVNASRNATTFQATFNIGLDAGNLVKNFSFNNITTNASRFNFCTGDADNVFVANMQLFYTAAEFVERDYFLSGAILSNNTNEIDLFLLPSAVGIEFFIDVEQNLFPLQGATISIAKFFVGEGVFKTTEIDMTNGDGKITSFLDLNKDYRFTITKEGELLGILEQRAICEAAPCTLSLSITDDTPDVYSGFNEIFASQVLYNLSYDGGLKRVIFEFVDTTGLATSFRMDIIKGIPNGTERIISSQRLFTSSGQMTYNHTESSGDFTAKIFITRSPNQIIDFLQYIISDISIVLGTLGLFVAFLIVITVIMGFAFSPRAFIFAIPLSLTLTKLMQIISISNGAIIVIYLLAIVAATFISR